MVDPGPGHLGARLQQLRKDRRLTLDDLARMSGVSRSMLSQIERSQANPTVATVWALAEALHIEVGELLGVTAPSQVARIDVASPSFTPEMRSEDGLCVLKILSPADKVGKVEWYEMRLGAGGVLRSAAHAKGSGEHVTVLRGRWSSRSAASGWNWARAPPPAILLMFPIAFPTWEKARRRRYW